MVCGQVGKGPDYAHYRRDDNVSVGGGYGRCFSQEVISRQVQTCAEFILFLI